MCKCCSLTHSEIRSYYTLCHWLTIYTVGPLPALKCITCLLFKPRWTHLQYLWLVEQCGMWGACTLCTLSTSHCAHCARYLLWISRQRHACTCLVIVHHHFGNICPLFDPVTIAFRPFWRIQDSYGIHGTLSRCALSNVAIENRDIPEFRAIDRSTREPICLFMRSARLRWLAAKKPVDRRRILDFVKLRAKRSPGQGKCGYVRRVVSQGDWVQHMQKSTESDQS